MNELNMSKQELIELIEKILNAEIKITTEISNKEITVKQESKEKALTSIEGLTLEEIADNPKLLDKYLSEAQLKNILIRFSFALGLQKISAIKSQLDNKNIEKLLQLEDLLKAELEGKLKSNPAEINQALDKYNNKPSPTPQTQQQNQQVGMIGRIMNQAKQVIEKSAEKMRDKINDVAQQLGIQTPDNQNQDPNNQNNPNNQANPNNQQRSANLTSRTNELSRQIRNIETRVRRDNPEVQRVRFNGRRITATVEERPRRRRRDEAAPKVEEKPTTKEVNLDDYLKENNKLTPDLQKDIEINLKAQKEMELNSKITQKESEINQIKGAVESLKSKAVEQPQQSSSKNSDSSGGSSSSSAKEVSVKPEVNTSTPNYQPVTINTESKDAMVQTKKESLKTADHMVTLDIVADKEKMLHDMKNAPDMKDIKTSIKKMNEDLKEAEQNKDLLKEMKNQRFQDKFRG